MGNWYINEIIIDSREKRRGQLAYNYFHDNYTVRKEPLPYGDYLFKTNDEKEIIFEYKSSQDFIHSMENGSLFQEISNQNTHYDYSYLIVIDNFDETFEYLYYNVSYYRYKYKVPKSLRIQLSNQITGALNRLYAMYTPVIFASDEKDAFKKMLNISLKIADGKKYGGNVRPIPKNLLENPIITFLTSIKGIGNAKAKNIVNDLGVESLKDLLELKPSDFKSVKRINDDDVTELWVKIHNEKVDKSHKK